MKEQLFFACTAFVFAGILACQQQPANVPDSKAPTTMIITDPKTGELDSAVAVASIGSWDKYRDSLQKWLRPSLPRVADEIPWGFKIASQDIHSLDSIARGTDSLYAMLALQPNRCTGKIELTLIFRAPDKKKAVRFYDFSEPCPPCVACDK